MPGSLGNVMKDACSGALVTCSGHLEGCISFMEKDAFERKKWILPFSAVTEQIVCECLFVHVFSDPLLLSGVLFPLPIW